MSTVTDREIARTREIDVHHAKGIPRIASAPAPPPAPPPPPVPPGPVAIPDGDPHAAALEIWRTVHPNAAGELRERIATIARELDDLVDHARTHEAMLLPEFVIRAAYWLNLRDVLAARLATMEGTDPPQRPAIAVEVFGLVVSIRRWKDREVLRVERTIAIGRIGSDLKRVEGDIQHLVITHGHSRNYEARSPAHLAGLCTSADLWQNAMVEALERRAGLRQRLEALGDDRQQRAQSITAIVTTTGEMAIVGTVAEHMPAPDHGAGELERALGELASRLASVDPETRLAEALSGDRKRLLDRLGDARKAQAGSKADAARRLVSEASAGSLESITELGRHVTQPELSQALTAARGSAAHFVAVVAELIAGGKP
jgi:hypothetical protein